jgi:hypothetical protein
MPPASSNSQNPGSPSTPPQSIPLRNLTRPPDSADLGDGAGRHARGRSLLSGGSRLSGGQNYGPRYERLGESSPSPNQRGSNRPQLSRLQTAPAPEEGPPPLTPSADFGDLQVAMGFAGLRVPDISISQAPQELSTSYEAEAFEPTSRYYDGGGDDSHAEFAAEADDIPLNDPKNMHPLSGAPFDRNDRRHDRFHSVSFSLPGPQPRMSRLGDDLESPETRQSPSKSTGYGPDGRRSRSPSTATALSRAGTIVRAMSQRVVNLSGETELIEESARREASLQSARRASRRSRTTSLNDEADSDLSSLDEESEPQIRRKVNPLGPGPKYQGKTPTTQAEKSIRGFGRVDSENAWESPIAPPNPLKGKSLGIFSANSRIRNFLCDVLVYPVTEPAILLLIVVQAILLAVSGSTNAYSPANDRRSGWTSKPIDLALFALFIIFTIEIMARIIVSGFIFNAPEYSNGNGARSLWQVIIDNYHAVFAPQRRASIRASRAATTFGAPHILRTFTGYQGERIHSVEQAQRLQLARRAFLRHSFNRLDLIAVVSFWISFILSMLGIESTYHLYVFRMMSCLRILRLLAITHGTSVCMHLTIAVSY